MEAPHVNGVSPCEGPPGTKVKIWGENLGLSAVDIANIKICGHECMESMEWISDRKIICKSGDGVGRGRIIITSISGGIGSCSVYFTGIEVTSPGSPRLNPLKESDTWIEEDWNIFEDHEFTGTSIPTVSAVPTIVLDPLGLIKKGASRRMSEEYISQLCPKGSGNLLSENFNPVMYLLENHCGTSFSQLQQGLNTLKAEVNKSQQAPGEFIRDNLDSFVQCYDTLSDVNELLIRNESESEGGSITDKMEGLLRDTTMEADILFQGLLKRKIKADATRNALTVLQRYRFLFNLPRSIEKNIKNQEYEIVTNDYERAKSLFAGTKVKVFAKVLKEVENLVSKLRSYLQKQLLQNPTTFETQKKLIKYLLDLDYMGDPAWECIHQMYSWILELLLSCKKQYHNEVQGDSDFLEIPTSGQGHLRTLSNISHSSGGSSFGLRGGFHSRTPETESKADSKPKRILFVEKLIDIVSTTLPHLYKLGQAYFGRTLFTTMLNENQDSIISDNISSKESEFEGMIMEIAEVYTDLVNASLFVDALEQLPKARVQKLGEWKPFEDDLAEGSGAWLPLCVRKIRGCLSSLQGLPGPPLSLIQQLAANVRTLSADTLFLRTTRDIEALYEREDWRVQDEEGSIITSLPVLFENFVVDVLLTLKEIVIENHPGELAVHREPLLSAAVEHFSELLEDFCCCLDNLTHHDEVNEESPKSMTHQETVISASEDALNIPSLEEQLLLILSNSNYTREYVTPRLFDCFTSHGYPECPQVQEKFTEQLLELDKRVFEAYINHKVQPLLSLVEPGMYAGYFTWRTETLPTDLRSYLKEILLYLVHVHAEVSSISAHMTKRVLSQLVEELSTEMLTQFKEVDEFSEQGKVYAYIEVLGLQETMKLYITDDAKHHFQSILDKIGNVSKKYSRNVRDIFEAFDENTSLQFCCFKPPEHQLK